MGKGKEVAEGKIGKENGGKGNNNEKGKEKLKGN